MFKVGDKVFDNERGYGEGVVKEIDEHNGDLFVYFNEKWHRESYTKEGRWVYCYPITLFKKEEKMNFYYVGQKVSHQAFGDGVVASITNSYDDYKIMVEFENSKRSFTVDGRLNKHEFPSLSQKPHVPLELEEVISFEKGELVWVRYSDVWDARYYSHFDGRRHCFFVNQKKDSASCECKEIRKFSDNPLTLNCYK